MRILDTLTFVLIAVIFSFVVADDVPYYVHLLGFVNTTTEDIDKFDIELCEKNGGPDTHAAHKLSREEYDLCTRNIELEFEEESKLEAASPEIEGIAALYRNYCRRIPEFENCLKDYTDSMKTCLDPEKHESADIVYNTLSKIGRFLCVDNAARIRKFTVAETDHCMETKINHVMNCTYEILGNYAKSVVSHGAELGGLGKLHLLVPDFNKCRVFDKFQDCAIRELKSCSDPTAGSIFNSIFNIVKDVADCKRFLSSHASPASVVNVVLITAALITAIFLRFVQR